MQKKVWTLPNLITSVRIVLLPVALYFFMKSTLKAYIVSLLLVVLMEFSDLFDGIVARKFNSTSNVGKIFDPFADHIYRISFFLFFSFKGFIPLWMFLICFYRDSLVLNVRIFAASQSVIMAARKSGKIKAQAQSVAIILFIILQIVNFKYRIINLDKIYFMVMYVVVVVTLWSALDYFFSVMQKQPKHMMIGTFSVALLMLLTIVVKSDYHRVIFQPSNLFKWDQKAVFKKILPNCEPQGIAVDDRHVYLTFTRSKGPALLTRFNRTTFDLEGKLEFSGAIQQPCGMALREGLLWVIDAYTGKLLLIDPARSFGEGQLFVANEVETGLEGASGIAFINYEGTPYLAISVFLKEGLTYLADFQKALRGTNFAYCICSRIKNYNFSQGLASDGYYLYDANSFWGYDRIFKIDIGKAIANESYNGAVVEVFNSPDQMSKGIFITRGEIWTTDEYTYRLYQGKLKR